MLRSFMHKPRKQDYNSGLVHNLAVGETGSGSEYYFALLIALPYAIRPNKKKIRHHNINFSKLSK